MDGDQISKHECLVYMALRDAEGWLSNADLAALLDGDVKPRTIRLHTKRLRDLGIIHSEFTFPGYRHQASQDGRDENYVTRLERAIEGMSL